MARLVGFVGISHSPFWTPGEAVEGTGARFAEGVQAVRERVAAWRPDALLVIGPDHFRNFFYDSMPSFCIGIGTVTGFGDYGTLKGELRHNASLATEIQRHVSGAGFDPAVSLAMGVDHGITQSFEALCPDADLPLIPIMISCAGPAMPTMARCRDFGRAIGQAIDRSPGYARIVVVASGGLSHWVRPVAPDDERTDPEIREYAISGRADAPTYSAMRDASVAERAASGAEGRVNAAWDAEFLAALESGSLDRFIERADTDIVDQAGNGALEIRAWIAGAAAWGGSVSTIAYEPVGRWMTGMACAASDADVGVNLNG